MKKSTKIISLGSILVSIILLIGCGIILFVTKNNTNHCQNNELRNYSTDNYNFFNNTKIDNGNNIKLKAYFDKNLVLEKLTNYLSVFDLKKTHFDNDLIYKNLINIVQCTISKIKSFKKIDEYYINVKYEVIYNSLILDIRWANKADILNQLKTSLYWDQIKISI